jgi:hypothetical protein
MHIHTCYSIIESITSVSVSEGSIHSQAHTIGSTNVKYLFLAPPVSECNVCLKDCVVGDFVTLLLIPEDSVSVWRKSDWRNVFLGRVKMAKDYIQSAYFKK